MQSAIDTVVFAGANPGKVKMLGQQHCPMHVFQYSHDDKGCTGGQPKKEYKKEDKKQDKKASA